MNFLVSASTDIGIKKSTNQDSLMVKKLRTAHGNMVFAILCDGMGGLEKGEVASATVVNAFNTWLLRDFAKSLQHGLDGEVIQGQWNSIIVEQNEKIMSYGRSKRVRLGTTVVAMLFTEENYYIMNVGDSRAYELGKKLELLTLDQTVVADEVRRGILTKEQAEVDSRRNILLQCVGASQRVIPDFFKGKVKKDTVYMLCSDGFRHEITQEEMMQAFHPTSLVDVNTMKESSLRLIELNKSRNETDNISVILVRTY